MKRVFVPPAASAAAPRRASHDMKRWLRVPLSVVFVLAASAGLMALVKFCMTGRLDAACYLMLVEFCHEHCWVGRPFSTFPLKCDQAADVVVMVLANLGLFAFSAAVSTSCLCCTRRYCGRRTRDAEAYLRLVEEQAAAAEEGAVEMRTMKRQL